MNIDYRFTNYEPGLVRSGGEIAWDKEKLKITKN